MTNTDDPKFDDFQNPEDERDQDQPKLDMYNDDADDEAIDLDEFFGDSAVELDLPEESLMGENTATYADELDIFSDLTSHDVDSEGTEVPLGDLDMGSSDVIEPNEFFDDLDLEPNVSNDDHVDMDTAAYIGEMPAIAEELMASEETDELFDGLEATDKPTDQMGMLDDHVLPLPVEDVPVVEDKKTKKGKKEKPQKKEKTPKVKKEKPIKVKKEKKPREQRAKKPWNIAEIDVALGIAAISIMLGCMFMLANFAMNL